ncbi:hypothetical protein K432DRAFT_397476 [Lepidopterella palustris CBS 459.81]|uniref:Zn(2)-C6 fungal-type domain-containing protein n=1 Tax=Lepidopterella palustris CBS 459.81 TaxID=1314670 RepID=A0A8E2E0L2_9PEZI|nr:hypothetical protein K432DRAFT_397476 [Lepidopterella palustris CBS 459.81]
MAEVSVQEEMSASSNKIGRRCDGEKPCTKCRASDTVCSFTKRPKSRIVYPIGYTTMIIDENRLLRVGLRAACKKLTAISECKIGRDVEPEASGSVHDLLESLGVLSQSCPVEQVKSKNHERTSWDCERDESSQEDSPMSINWGVNFDEPSFPYSSEPLNFCLYPENQGSFQSYGWNMLPENLATYMS